MNNAEADAASIVNDLDVGQNSNIKSEDIAQFCHWMKKNTRRIVVYITLVLTYWLVCFLFIYYEAYPSVYPGSKTAATINKGGLALWIFQYGFCYFGLLVTLPFGFYFAIYGIGFVYKKFGLGVAIPFGIVWFGVCMFLATWQMWLEFVFTPIWTNNVLNSACQGWDMSIMLAGISSTNLEQSLPFLGVATVTIANGSYAMQLEQSSVNHNIIYFYTLNTTNAEPPFSNVTYNTYNLTYTVENVTAHYTTTPNLAISSRGMSLVDPSIPFVGSGPPSANLVLKNGTHVLNTATTLSSDCTQLKACAMYDAAGDFEVALGLVMIQQSQYAQNC